jgi:hypothetical protein
MKSGEERKGTEGIGGAGEKQIPHFVRNDNGTYSE